MQTIFFSTGLKNPAISQAHSFLCNFYPSAFVEDSKHYQTVEHYFQSKKFDDENIRNLIIQAETPKKAKAFGRKYPMNVEYWNQIKIDVMKNALRLKFTQDEELKNKLIETRGKRLAEFSNSDAYWGGSLENSENKLGDLLMELREELSRV